MSLIVLALAALMLAMSPFIPGVAIALSASAYTLRGAFDLPTSVSALFAAAPLFYFAPRALRILNLNYQLSDFYVVAFLFYMVFSSVFIASGSPVFQLMVMDAMTFFGFYFFGRCMADFTKNGNNYGILTSTQLFVGLFIIGLSYLVSDKISQVNNRFAFDDFSPVGLSQVLNIWMCVCVGIIIYCIQQFMASSQSKTVSFVKLYWLLGVAVTVFLYLFGLLIENGTRGALVSLFAATTLAVCFKMARKPSILTLCLWFFAVVIVGGMIVFVDDLVRALPLGTDRFSRLIMRLAAMMGSDIVTVSVDASVAGREILQDNAFRLFDNHPIFGCGYLCATLSKGYPHNLFIEILANHGLVGVVLAGLFFGTATFRALVALRLSEGLNPTVASIVFLSLLISFQFSFSISQGRMLFLFAGVVMSLGSAVPVRPARPAQTVRRQTKFRRSVTGA